MKSYTDLEQSKRLTKILPIESADMRYGYIAPYEFSDRMYEGGYDNVPYPKDFLEKNPNFSENDYDDSLPCWSLAALLGAVDFITINLFYIDERGYWVVSATIHNSTKLCTKYESAMAFNPVDACYELIIKLHEQNLL